MSWVKALRVDELDKPGIFNHPPRQLALFRVDGAVFAIDNRCPHEGYPLAAGAVNEDCVLTCKWHNWKFRLNDGVCILGGDNVRTYPTRVDEGEVWVDITELPREQVWQNTIRGLRTAFEDRDFGRTCREVARLQFHAIDLREAVREAMLWYFDRLEFGTTHAAAAATDWLTLAQYFPDDVESQIVCVSEAVDHLAFDSLRRRAYPYSSAPSDPFERHAFLQAIELEQSERAESMVARGLADGLHWNGLEQAFAEAALAHYNDFGHSLIYIMKGRRLIDQLGPSVEAAVALPLARHICYATREDLLPEFRDYAGALDRLPEPRSDPKALTELEIPFPCNIARALDWLAHSLATHNVDQIYDALLTALSLNMIYLDLSFDRATDRPVSQNIGWLDLTHGLTISNAARTLCSRYPHLWRPALAQMALFLGRNAGYLDRTIDGSAWQVDDAAAFFTDAHARIMDHGFREPIFSVHLLKTTLAVEDELPHASERCRNALLGGLNRFLHSPIKTKHVRRQVRQAIALVSRDFKSEGNPNGSTS